jgi:hypothetical protein
MRFVSREYHFVILCRYGADMDADTSPDPNANADTDADTYEYVCWNIRTVRGYGSWYEYVNTDVNTSAGTDTDAVCISW